MKCALTGRLLTFARDYRKSKGEQTASLDRIDNSQSYTEDNVQWVHKTLNVCKQTLHNNDFIKMCAEVTKYHNQEGNNV